ncbi:MAG: TonB-dependent receptor [Rhodothermaceae bacterium]
MKSVKLFFTILFFLQVFLFARNGQIVGKVTDEHKLSLTGANIFIKELSIGASTNNDGEFKILNIRPGKYQLTISYIGYQPQTMEIVVAENITTEISVKLNSGVVVGEEVLVLGDRLKGQARALNIQRSNANITNVVSSDQIGRFPDANIGDALKRIPSITVNYDQGEARFANIRGTEPRLNSITINGERIPSAEGEVRAVQLDLIPSDVIETIEVNKAVTPDMDADAIGGSVNLVTRQVPHGMRIAGTLGSGYNFLSEKPIYSGSLILSNRFANDLIGVVVSGSYHDHHLGSDNTEGEWAFDDNNKIYAKEWDIRKYDLIRERISFTGAVDFKFSPTSKIILSGIYNNRKDWENRFRLRYKLDEPNAQGISEETEIRRQTKGGINNDDNDNRRLEDQVTSSLNLKGEHVLGKDIKLNWSASYAKASEERPNERYISYRVKDVPVQVNLADTKKPYFIENTPLGNFSLKEITEEYQYTEEKDFNARFDFEIPFIKQGNYKNELKFGAKYKSKEKERDNNFYEYELTDKGEALYDQFNQMQLRNYTDEDYLAGDYKIGQFVTPEFLGRLNLKDPTLFKEVNLPEEYAADNYEAKEKITAGYVQLNQKLGKKWSMIAGLRIEHTKVDYDGNEFDVDNNKITPTSGSDNYTNVLPGIHLKYDYDENTILRIAWTNTIARPNYYHLVPYRKLAEDREELEVGNQALEPTTSMNFDIMGEKYFRTVGLISAGVFYKMIDDFIYVHSEKNYSDPVSGKVFEKYLQPRNGAEAKLFGFEVAFQRQLDFLGGFFRNIGLYTNYTYTWSTTDNPSFPENDLELPGTAPHTLNASLTFQTEKIVLGVSFNYSSAYIDGDELDLTPGLERYYDEVTYLDINGSYAITPKWRFFFEANNLLNQPLRYYAGSSSRTFQAEYYNARFNAGVKFDF